MNDELEKAIREMRSEPGSTVRMCHEQGKTAVYLSKDRRSIVRHHPNGSIERTPYRKTPRGSS